MNLFMIEFRMRELKVYYIIVKELIHKILLIF